MSTQVEYYVVYRLNDNLQIKCKNIDMLEVGVWLYIDNEPRMFIPYTNLMQIVEYDKDNQ